MFLRWRTQLQIPVWSDSETLWSQAVSEEPSAFALTNLGVAYFTEGDSVGALELYRRAIAMDPHYGLAHDDLAGAYMDPHRLDDAIREFHITQELMPDLAGAYNGSGTALRLEGKLDEAIRDYRHALQINPDYAPASKNLEEALSRKHIQSEH